MVVVGGGPAGLSAALVLGRMRRWVLVLDTDAPANAVSKEVHGFLSRDGTPPAEVRAAGREQLLPYESVDCRPVSARSARRLADGRFEVGLEDGTEVVARRLLLAHGMRYRLPDLGGLAELWGRRVFHCPYCHGWEVRDQPLGVYGRGSRAAHQALMLGSLSNDVVLLSDGDFDLTNEERERLERAGVDLYDHRVERLEQDGEELSVVFAGRPPLVRHALFIQPVVSLASELAGSLGAALTDKGTIETDEAGKTTVAGMYAAGDAGATIQSVAVATGTCARAAYAINAELALEDAASPSR